MVDLIIAEFMKLKRNKMFMLSLLGALAAPMMCFVGLLKAMSEGNVATFEAMFSDSMLYTFLIIGLLLYAIMAAYLFSREQTENTIKTIITLPVSKNKYLTAKFIMLFLWIICLSFVTWLGTLILSFIGDATNPSANVIFDYLWKFLAGGSIVFVTLTPFVFLALLTKNLVPVMIIAAMTAMVCMAIASESWSMLFPWTAILSILIKGFVYSEFPIWLPYVIFSVVGIVGMISSYVYFNKKDIA